MLNIHARVKHLVNKCGTRDPEKIASILGIEVSYENLSEETKGFYINLIKNNFIVINSNLNKDLKRIVLSHELGHALLHYSKSICFIREYTIFPRGVQENEANKFAAELLISDDEIDKSILQNMSIEQIASYYGVQKKLIELKFNKFNI